MTEVYLEKTLSSISPINVVHLGAHRTGSTLFQEYIYNAEKSPQDLGYTLLGIDQTRNGLMKGLLGYTPQAEKVSQEAAMSLSRIEKYFLLAKYENRGLLISDENIMGTMERNFKTRSLYPDLKAKLKMLSGAFKHVDRFYISIRNLEEWWNSCFSYLISRNSSPPDFETLESISQCCRSWRDVVLDIMQVYPNAEIYVREFNFLTDNPKQQLMRVTGSKIFQDTKNLRINSNGSAPARKIRKILLDRNDLIGAISIRGEGKYQAFEERQSDLLRKIYNRDIFWMRANITGNHKFLEPNIS